MVGCDVPLNVFRRFFAQNAEQPLGVKLAELRRTKAAMQAGGFGGSQISRNWRDLVDTEERLKARMADRHWAALRLAEEGERERAMAIHRENYHEQFHVADTYEVLAMYEQQRGRFGEAIEIMDTGIHVFEHLVDPEMPHREETLAWMRRRRERLERKRAQAAGTHA